MLYDNLDTTESNDVFIITRSWYTADVCYASANISSKAKYDIPVDDVVTNENDMLLQLGQWLINKTVSHKHDPVFLCMEHQ